MPEHKESIKHEHRISKLSTSNGTRPKYIANILPCKIHHNGKVNASTRLWKPKPEQSTSTTVHFRGRRLEGSSLKLLDNYQTYIVKRATEPVEDSSLKAEMVAEFERDTAESDPASREAEEADLKTVIRNGEFSIEQAFPLQTVADVDEVVVWGHDDPPEATSDPYLRATQEWIAMASAMHSPGTAT